MRHSLREREREREEKEKERKRKKERKKERERKREREREREKERKKEPYKIHNDRLFDFCGNASRNVGRKLACVCVDTKFGVGNH
jgi:hypothetical protein